MLVLLIAGGLKEEILGGMKGVVIPSFMKVSELVQKLEENRRRSAVYNISIYTAHRPCTCAHSNYYCKDTVP
jgi:hypothetical protein